MKICGIYACADHKCDAVYERNAAAHRHKSIHIRRAVENRLCAAHEKLSVDDKYDEREHKFVYSDTHRVAVQRAHIPAEHNAAHRHVHKGDKQDGGHGKADYRADKRIDFFLFLRFIVKKSGLIPRARNGTFDFFDSGRLVKVDGHLICEKVHGDVFYAVKFPYDLIDARGARRATHTVNVEFKFFHNLTISVF